MVRYRRHFVPGGTYFFTVTLADRTASLLADHIVSLRAAFIHARHRQKFAIDAAVVLPEHLHTLITLAPGDTNFPSLWRRIKSRFTRDLITSGVPLRRNMRGEYDLWQRRYWEHTIRDENDFARHVDYIHFNPVKHGLAARPADWPHSSLHRYINQGLIAPDWGGDHNENADSFGEP